MYTTFVKRFIYLTFVLLLTSTAACSLFDETDTAIAPNPSSTAEIPTPVNTPAAEVPNTTPQATTNELNRLIVWTIPSISPRSEIPGGAALASQLAVFDENHPDFELFVELKAATGQGGILSYLQAGKGVAPAILPDLALIPAEQIPEAVSSELVYPLDPLLRADLIDDLYPVGRQLGTVDGQLYGYPYALTGIQHIVYDTSSLETMANSWLNMVDTGTVLVFPINNTIAGRLLLQFYLTEGGTLVDGTNQPNLEAAPLTTALTQINTIKQDNIILPQTNSLATLTDSWLVFQNSTANATITTAEQFLQIRAQENTDVYAFTAVPGPRGPLASQVSGWAWVITTSDPARQALAAELLTWLVNGPNVGEWSQQVQRLPARRAAFESWPDEAYIRFLQSELERAAVYPQVANGVIIDALTQAMVVMTSPAGSSPEVLAETTIQAIKP